MNSIDTINTSTVGTANTLGASTRIDNPSCFDSFDVIREGDQIKVCHLLTSNANTCLKSIDGKNLYEATVDFYAAGEKYGKNVWKHLRQVLPVRPGKLVQDVRSWPRLRKACEKAGVQLTHIPGGMNPLHYVDEIAIQNFSMSGATYYVLKRSEISKILEYSPMSESGRQRQEKIRENSRQIGIKATRIFHEGMITASAELSGTTPEKITPDAEWLAEGFLVKWLRGYSAQYSRLLAPKKGEAMKDFLARTHYQCAGDYRNSGYFELIVYFADQQGQPELDARFVLSLGTKGHFEYAVGDKACVLMNGHLIETVADEGVRWAHDYYGNNVLGK